MKKFLSLLLSILCCSLGSCSEEVVPDVAEIIYEGETVGPQGGVARLVVTANGTWTVSASQSWARLSPAHGDGDAEVFVTFPQNPNYQSRTLTVTLKRGNAEASCDVSQAPKAVEGN